MGRESVRNSTKLMMTAASRIPMPEAARMRLTSCTLSVMSSSTKLTPTTRQWLFSSEVSV